MSKNGIESSSSNSPVNETTITDATLTVSENRTELLIPQPLQVNNKVGHYTEYVSKSTLKDMLLLYRRAFSQCVASDERLIGYLSKTKSNNSELDELYLELKKNAEDRKKFFMQIVRDTEKRYGMKPSKRRRRKNK